MQNTTSDFDRAEFNRRITKLRGENWRKKLIKGKLYKTPHPTAMKYRRVELGLTQKDMLQRVGIKVPNTYGRIERAKGYADSDRARKIAKVLQVPVDDIFIEIQPDKYLAV